MYLFLFGSHYIDIMIILINYIIIAGTNMAVKKIDYDEDILTKINGFGRWQLCLFMILWLPSAFSAFAVFMYSFIAFWLYCLNDKGSSSDK